MITKESGFHWTKKGGKETELKSNIIYTSFLVTLQGWDMANILEKI